MTRTRIKICGITQPEHALACARYGADAIGLVFYTPSPRAVTVSQAKQILHKLPAFVTTVGLFVNPSVQEVKSVLAQVPLDYLQFHGDEESAFCSQFERPYIKAIRMHSDMNVLSQVQTHPQARGFLLDTYVKDIAGGTGASFDWHRVPVGDEQVFILAGGLHAGNVAEAIRIAKPYAVDVSGGVEKAKGVKDPALIKQFIDEVNHVGTG